MLPSPKAIRAMTAAVPMMMPSTERMARSLCSQRLRKASDQRAPALVLEQQHPQQDDVARPRTEPSRCREDVSMKRMAV